MCQQRYQFVTGKIPGDFIDVGGCQNFAGLGMAYEALGNLQESLASYQAAIQLDPDNFTASNGVERVQKLINK